MVPTARIAATVVRVPVPWIALIVQTAQPVANVTTALGLTALTAVAVQMTLVVLSV